MKHQNPSLFSDQAKMNRRRFVAAMAAIGVAGPQFSNFAAEPELRPIPVGVQLWTLRNEIAEDLPGTLKQVAAIGYQGIELWFRTWPDPKLLKKITQDLGLKISSAHVNLADLKNDFDRTTDYHHELDNRLLVIPYLPNFQKFTDADWLQTVDEIRDVAQRASKKGFQVFYHNHDFEFLSKVGDVEALDLIFGNVDEEYLKAELDLFFLADTGRDPVKYLEKFAGRVKLVHLKEKSKPGAASKTTELGRGVIDWPAALAAARKAGVQWFLVEQDCENRPALDSIRVSFDYLKSLGQVAASKG